MLGLIPMIGNTLAAILVVMAALVLKDTTSALILLVFFVVYQQIENVTLQPMVQGKTTSMPPLVVFVSVILGTALIGPIGGFFAIPAAGCMKVLLLDYFQHRDDLKVNDSPMKLASKIRHKLTGKNPNPLMRTCINANIFIPYQKFLFIILLCSSITKITTCFKLTPFAKKRDSSVPCLT